MEKGRGSVWIDSSRYLFKPGTVLAIAKSSVVRFDFNFDKDIQLNKIRSNVILFTEEYIYERPEDLTWINNLRLFDMSCKSTLIKIPVNKFEELGLLIKKIKSELKSQDNFGCEEISINMLKTIIVTLERIIREKSEEKTAVVNNGSLHLEFRRKLEENYSHTRSVKYYADLLNVTPKKLNQAASNYLGGSSKKIIEERVILEVKRLLIHTEQTVREIGFSMGFKDPTNFNKFFKRHTKATPAEFRHANKKDC